MHCAVLPLLQGVEWSGDGLKIPSHRTDRGLSHKTVSLNLQEWKPGGGNRGWGMGEGCGRLASYHTQS